MADTRLEAAVNAVVDRIIEDTGIEIHPPPLKGDGDCAVRVSGDRTMIVTLNGQHAEKEVKCTVYCKAGDSQNGVEIITAIQDYIDNLTEMPESDVVHIENISADSVSENNNTDEWIYEMIVTIRYCY